MKLRFKQRLFSWLDSYDIYDEAGNTVYTVKGQLSWGHKLKVMDARGNEVALLQEKLLSWLPRFEMYVMGELVGTIRKEWTLFKPRFHVDYNGWEMQGNFWEWDYDIHDRQGGLVATVNKEILNWTDTYVIDVVEPAEALNVLMLVLAIDAEKCSRD